MARLPNALPILRDRIARDGLRRTYDEREITTPTDLCDASGRLRPEAVGWSRRPLVRANLTGHRLRKKRWNFWNFIGPEFVLSVTAADLDYAGFCAIDVTDFETKRTTSTLVPFWPGSVAFSDRVESSIEVRRGSLSWVHRDEGDRISVAIRATAKGAPIAADLVVTRPAGHETLNLVVPWSETRFQLNSKHAALPTAGEVRVGDRVFAARPEECHAVQDFGRGVWPYHAFWNWGVATGVEDGVSIGVNFGDKWTTGTGVNENALCIDGRLHKVMEDLDWTYDPARPLGAWRVAAPTTGMIDLTLEPIVARTSGLSLGVLRTGGVCSFGRWRGTIRFEGRELGIRSLLGWAEEFEHRW